MTLFHNPQTLTEEPVEMTQLNLPPSPERLAHINIEASVYNILKNIGEEPEREGLLNTPNRVARMFDEPTPGYHVDPEKTINGVLFVVDFDVMVLVKDIDYYSLCEHHPD
jgi:GTP cyclohydrolase I